MSDLKTQNVEDMKKEIAEKREALRVFRFGESGSRSRNVREGRSLRRSIARILTELRARTHSADKGKIASTPKKM
jgi:ribosomal protein L29